MDCLRALAGLPQSRLSIRSSKWSVAFVVKYWGAHAYVALLLQTSRPSLKLSLKRSPSTPALPPFSRLDAVANGERPPLSPMSFSTPDDNFSFSPPVVLFI